MVSTKSGHIFERSVVEKHLAETGACPVTGEPLSTDDLLAVARAPSLQPRAPPAASIPGLLTLFQNEWDALMLETHQMRQQLHGLRKELSAALYQNDAACRVIARLLREKEETGGVGATGAGPTTTTAPSTTASRKRARPDDQDQAQAQDPSAPPTTSSSLPAPLVAAIEKQSQLLASTRKATIKSRAAAAPQSADVLAMSPHAHPLHQSGKGGIHALARAGSVVASGGEDHTVRTWNLDTQQIEYTPGKGHTKRVTGVGALGSSQAWLSGSLDGTVKVWSGSSGDGGDLTIRGSLSVDDKVVGVSVHPLETHALVAAAGGTWTWVDTETMKVVLTASESTTGELTGVVCHPDGALAGMGTGNGDVLVWDVRAPAAPAARLVGGGGRVTALAFSEDGYRVGLGTAENTQMWDLRKLARADEAAHGAHALAFDPSGTYLAAGEKDGVRLYTPKGLGEVGVLHGPFPKKGGGVHALVWGEGSRSLAAGAGDHKVRVFAVSS